MKAHLLGGEFEPWDRVKIDGDASLVGVVTCFQFRPASDGGWNCLLEVSYIHNGDAKTAWIEAKRLSKA